MDADRKRVGKERDFIMPGKHNAEPQSSIGELDPWTAWAYRPHTISLLFIGACLLVWVSGALSPDMSTSIDSVTAAKRGVLAMILVFLVYCLLQAPSTILIRPHPAVWRLVHGLAVVYLVALTFLLFQDLKTGTVIGTGKLVDGLYVFDSSTPLPPPQAFHADQAATLES